MRIAKEVRAAGIVAGIVVILTATYAILSCRKTSIYMDHNGTTPIHPRALVEFVAVSRDMYGNPSTACVVGQLARDMLEKARGDVCELIGCKQTELLFTSGATESNILAIRGFCRRSMRAHGKCVVITTQIEHASVKNTVKSVQEDGVIVKYVSVDRFGIIDQNDLVRHVRESPTDVPIMFSYIWINNEIGTIQDAPNISRLCRQIRPDIHVHLDATQAIGRYMVAMEKLNVDTMSFSAHKFCGPHGVGALYMRTGTQIAAIMTGGRQEKGLRGGTENVAGCVAMAAALRMAVCDLTTKNTMRRMFAMRNKLLSGLKAHIPGLIVNTHPERCAYNTISVCLPCDSRQLIEHLSSKHNICLAVGSACSRGGMSSTLEAVGVSADALRGSLRISLGRSNTEAECACVLRRIVDFLEKECYASGLSG